VMIQKGLWIGLVVMLALGVGLSAQAQEDGCSTPRSISYPIDTNVFQLVQDFGTASPRHQGRYHTAEDWFAGRGSSLGQPVRAAASGVVTYSSPLAWGRDGGVIIIRHILEDGTVYYTQYGHLVETETIRFPTRLTCVEAGDLLGVIGSVRPAPHLHFEIRVNQPDIPGPGYTREDPESLGWRRPAQVIANLQAVFNPAHRWHFDGGVFAGNPPPLVLNDNSLITMHGDWLRRVLPDGRVLWRSTLASPAVGVAGYQANSYVIFADGTVQLVDVTDGSFGQLWQIDDFSPDQAPMHLGDDLLFHTTDDALVLVSADLREVIWRLEGIPAYRYGHVSGALIALVTGDSLWLVSHQGQLLDQAILEHGANLSTAPDGSLIAYTYGGLWQIDPAGQWSERVPAVPPGGENAAAAVLDDGRIFLVSGSTIFAYTPEAMLSWQANLPQEIGGRVSITPYQQVLLMTSNHGQIVAVQTGGGICGSTRIYGNDQAQYWHDLGDDGVLRLAVGDQLLGLDWQRFINGC
jgi:outer membrane protein assembly factor BamB